MSVRYAIQVVKATKGRLRAVDAEAPTDDQLSPFDATVFGPGLYVVEGAKKTLPKGELEPQRMKEWFVELDGALGKDIGGALAYRIFQSRTH
jgi:hypothetical protein